MIKVFSEIYKIKDEWNALFSSNDELSVYQSFSWNENLFSRYKLLRTDRKRFSVIFLLYYDDADQLKIIAPLSIPQNTDDSIIIFGGGTKTGILNFVYSNDVKNSDFISVFNYLFESYPNQKIALREVPRETKLGRFLGKSSQFTLFFNRGSVRCAVPNSKDELLKSLSKSVRQTIRTSYNRMKRNEVESKLVIDYGYHFCISEKRKLNDLQIERKRHWGYKIDNEDANLIMKTKQLFRDIITDPIFRYSGNKEFTYVRFYIGNEIAAYFFGLRNEVGYCIVPTLIHNVKFKEYNPGLLMIFEFLNKMIETKEIKVFDLSRGVDEYKMRYLPNPEIYDQDMFDCENNKKHSLLDLT